MWCSIAWATWFRVSRYSSFTWKDLNFARTASNVKFATSSDADSIAKCCSWFAPGGRITSNNKSWSCVSRTFSAIVTLLTHRKNSNNGICHHKLQEWILSCMSGMSMFVKIEPQNYQSRLQGKGVFWSVSKFGTAPANDACNWSNGDEDSASSRRSRMVSLCRLGEETNSPGISFPFGM